MAIIYSWNISTCEREVANGGIIVAHWECIATDEDYSARAYSTCSFTPDPSASDFTPYDSVTESQVLGWCWADNVDKDATEAALAANIEKKKNPTYTKGTPW